MRAVVSFAIIASMASSASASPEQTSYDLKATVKPETGTIEVDTSISMASRKAGDHVDYVLGGTYQIRKLDAGPFVKIDVGQSVKPWSGLQSISMHFTRAVARPKLHVVYDGKLSPSGDPPLNEISPKRIELNLDSMWLPVRSDLGARFSVTALIAGIPPIDVVVSQGDVRHQGADVIIHRRLADIDLPLIAIPQVQLVAERAFQLYARDPANERARLYQKHGNSAVQFLEDWFGPLPGKPARMVVVPRERVSGYARKGLIVVTEGSDSPETGVAKFVAHEFSHSWFSNANATDDSRWVDESIAEYVGVRYVEHVLGKQAAEKMWAVKRANSKGVGPILGAQLGNDELYTKGPALLADLEVEIGRQAMDRLIAEVARNRIGTTDAFLKTLSTVAGPAAASQFKTALRN